MELFDIVCSGAFRYCPLWSCSILSALELFDIVLAGGDLKAVLGSKLSVSELELVVQAAILLLQVPGNPDSTGGRHPVTELAECLVSNLLSLCTECSGETEQCAGVQELSSQVTKLLCQCSSQTATRRTLLRQLCKSAFCRHQPGCAPAGSSVSTACSWEWSAR